MFRAVKCENYEEERVRRALKELINLEDYVEKGDTVLVKPNLLLAARPDKAVTTHPVLVKVLVEELETIGVKKVIIADSPGGKYTKENLRKVYKATGMEGVANETSAELNYDTGVVNVENRKGWLKNYDLLEVFEEVDKVINVPKVKTHMLTTLTCACKNLFGLIPGNKKVGYHGRFKKVEDFSKMLVDLSELTQPCLNIIDAVVGMEGEGPNNGDAKRLGVIAVGDNTFEADYEVSKLINILYKEVPYLVTAEKKGLFETSEEEYEDLRESFKKPHASLLRKGWNVLPNFVKNLISDYWVKKPVIKKNCIGCGACAEACPTNAIRIVNGRARIDYNKCIRCYCCHELCNHDAVELEKRLF